MYQIREYQNNDKEQLRQLVIDSDIFQKQHLEKEAVDLTKVRESSSGMFDLNLNNPERQYFVSIDDGKVIGFILVEINRIYTSHGSIDDLYILPEYRNQGLATKLIYKGIDYLKEQEVQIVELAVHESNQEAILLYNNAGFKNKPDEYIYLVKKIQLK